MNPKNGFAVADCEDIWAKRVLQFLIPILYLEKPTQVMVMVGNTILGALLGERKVDWGIVLQFVVAKLVENVKKKATSIGPYMFHMYARQEVLLPGEVIAYNIGCDLVKYNCIPDLD